MKRFILCLLVPLLCATSAGATAPPKWYAPLLKLPHSAVRAFECVIYHESRSTFARPNLGDDNANPGDSGIFQIDNTSHGVWGRWVLPHLHVLVWRASAYDQAWGAVTIYRHDGFAPWSADAMCFS